MKLITVKEGSRTLLWTSIKRQAGWVVAGLRMRRTTTLSNAKEIAKNTEYKS